MRDVVFFLSVSVDGFFEDLDGGIDWHHVDEALHTHLNDVLRGSGAFLEGRRTWQLMADYWPHADEAPDASPAQKDFAGIWRGMPKVVYSRTLEEAGWGTEIRREVDPEEIRAMKREAGGDLIIGGPDLVRTFERHDLVDVYHLYVHPVIRGAGHRLFAEGQARRDVRLEETRRFDNGVVLLRYRRVRPDSEG